ncbi:hypothetical protein ACQKEN_20870 [Pseudomonas sp. NPDC078416]
MYQVRYICGVAEYAEIKIKILKIKSVCLGADRFAFGELLGKVESRTIPK